MDTNIYKQKQGVLFLLCLFLALTVFQVEAAPLRNIPVRQIDRTNLRADEVLVIANRASKDSLSLARYYMERRKIPKENLFTVDFPNYQHPQPISHHDFQKKMVLPLKRYLELNLLKEKILCFVTVFDVPYTVSGPTGSPAVLKKALKRRIDALENQFRVWEGEDQKNEEKRKKQENLLQTADDMWQDLVKALNPAYRHRAKMLRTGVRRLRACLALQGRCLQGQRCQKCRE